MDGAGGILKFLSLIGLVLAACDYFDLTHRLEAWARTMSTGLWSGHRRYWHYVYHSTEHDRTGVGKVLADLVAGAGKVLMPLLVIGFLVFGRDQLQQLPWARALMSVLMVGFVVVMISPLVVMAFAWALRLLAMPRKGIVATFGLLLSAASATIDFMR